MTTIHVHTRPDGLFELRTNLDSPVGDRMVSVSAAPGRELPTQQTVFDNRIDAAKAAADWIVYLEYARRKKKKSRK